MVEQTIQIPEVLSSIGLYGGAVDGGGNFCGVENNNPARLVRVDRQDFGYQIWNPPGYPAYGIAVDSNGRPWLCGQGRSITRGAPKWWPPIPSP